jgi:hypothetical protein
VPSVRWWRRRRTWRRGFRVVLIAALAGIVLTADSVTWVRSAADYRLAGLL